MAELSAAVSDQVRDEAPSQRLRSWRTAARARGHIAPTSKPATGTSHRLLVMTVSKHNFFKQQTIVAAAPPPVSCQSGAVFYGMFLSFSKRYGLCGGGVRGPRMRGGCIVTIASRMLPLHLKSPFSYASAAAVACSSVDCGGSLGEPPAPVLGSVLAHCRPGACPCWRRETKTRHLLRHRSFFFKR